MNTNLFEEAKRYIVGGVNSPVRSFKMVDLPPVFVKKAKGKYIYTEDGSRFTDYCMSWGAIILGHNNTIVKEAVSSAIKNGLNFGLCHRAEAELAKLIQRAFPSMERMRFVSSGTEAVMSAIRVARGFTKRKKILKFDGCYHGHVDYLLVKSGSGLAEIKESSSEGIPVEIISNTLSIPFNDCNALKNVFKRFGREIACVILELVPANMGLIIPDDKFLSTLVGLCKQYDALLIADEVITGFRLTTGGAQHLLGIRPDLTVLGKIIGGGLPVGCFGGKREIMENLAPLGGVYQAGTLSGNPLVMNAGVAVLSYLFANQQIYKKMHSLIEYLATEWRKNRIPLRLNCFGTIFSIFYTPSEVKNYSDSMRQDLNLFKKAYRRLIERDILFPPSCFEVCFTSLCHNEADIETILEVFKFL